MNDKIYVFDGTFFGFFSVVFECFSKKNFDCKIQDEFMIQESLLYEYQKIETDFTKAERVANGIKNKISKVAFENINFAFLGTNENRFTDILKYIRLGFKVGQSVDNYKSYDYVLNVLKARRTVAQEAHLLTGFMRFSETKEKVLYSKIAPDNDVIEVVAVHFADRFKDEKWVINDVKRKKCAIYANGEFIILNDVDELNISNSDDEELWQNLWKEFFSAIAIENRRNIKLQNQMLPKKFRKYMPEFLNGVN